MSDDLIRRSDAVNAILGSLNNEAYKSSWESGAVKEVEQTLKRLPSVSTIEPKRGEWIVKQSGFAECSVCEQHYFSDYNFCPNCGASMREREGE